MTKSDRAVTKRVVEAELRSEELTDLTLTAREEGLPSALILGDSISIGYTPVVARLLAGKAAVSRPNLNCQHSAYGLANLDEWLGDRAWDVIHFNFGIWDTHYLDEAGELMLGADGGQPAGKARLRHTSRQYRENLEAIIERLKSAGATLIWASTTPIMYRTGERFNDIMRLNEVAADLMQEHGIVINDLYSYVLPHVKEWQSQDQCHFAPEGNEALGKIVSDYIMQAVLSCGRDAD